MTTHTKSIDGLLNALNYISDELIRLDAQGAPGMNDVAHHLNLTVSSLVLIRMHLILENQS